MRENGITAIVSQSAMSIFVTAKLSNGGDNQRFCEIKRSHDIFSRCFSVVSYPYACQQSLASRTSSLFSFCTSNREMVLLNEKFSSDKVSTPTRTRRVHISARPMDFVYFTFFAVRPSFYNRPLSLRAF